MRFEQQLRTFLGILEEYQEDMPLAKFLPAYFKKNKQMGSTDRRVASALLYNYFRLGCACAVLPAEERLFIALFLCGQENNSHPTGVYGQTFLNHFKPEWNEKIGLSLEEKLSGELQSFHIEGIFPFHKHLSKEIDKMAFLKSILVQPDLFIRVYPEKLQFVKAKLDAESIVYTEEKSFETLHTFRLTNGTKLDILFPDDSLALYEIQDLSSQLTSAYYRPKPSDYWWDACAASGGKSLLLYHLQPQIKLLVSDVRESVLNNLDERLHKAGLFKYQKKVLDLTNNPDPDIHDYQFDGIILDTPCTGSGTWGRTPEMISQFEESTIKGFQLLQRAIVKNVVKYLKPGMPLVYITCSVFKEENEEMVDYLVKEFGLKVESLELLKGYEHKADTMFVARLLN
jgi:16S rRNA (cytosine967-C5)-methyltransferase